MNQKVIASEDVSLCTRLFRFWIPRILAAGVGLILLVAGLIKALDMELFIRQIKDYGIITERILLIPSAWGLIVLECGLGAGLLVLYRPRWVFSLTAMLWLIFVAATGWAWLTGATGDCGCYGAWLKHTPGQAAVENLILLAATAWAGAAYWHAQAQQSLIKTLAVVIACITGLVVPFASGLPHLRPTPSQSRLYEEKASPIQVHGLEHVDLNHGVYLIVLMGTDCLHCQEAVPELNALTEVPDLPPLIALCTSEESDCVRFTDEFEPAFPIGHISEDAFWRLLADGDMPRVILLHDGRIEQVWDQMVPDEGSVRAKLPVDEE